MFLIGTVNNVRMAQAFVDYANGLGADCRLKEAEQGCEIWLLNGEKRVQIAEEFEEFQRNPQQGKYVAASWQTPNQQIEVNNDLSRNPNREFVSMIFRKSSFFTTSVLVLCSIIYMLTYKGDNPLYPYLYFTPIYQDFTWSQPWRLITPAIIHFSAVHLAMNVAIWWHFAGNIEMKQSKLRIVTIFLTAAILSNTAQYLVSGSNFGGLSGVVYALFGYCWVYSKLQPSEGLTIQPALFGFCLFWMAAGFFQLLPINMANTAHLVGLLSGLGLGYYFTTLHRKSS